MSDTPQTPPLKTTPLDALHRELGAKMVPFAGYDMPVQYPAGILKEHLHTRAHAALFDVSHMGQAFLRGENAAKAFEKIVPGDYQGMAAGKTRYSILTNDKGGILDDLMATQLGGDLYLVVNAACKEQDFAHIAHHTEGAATLEIIDDRALLALQGPEAETVLARLCPPARHMLFMSFAELTIAAIPCFVTRSGYTGEDGYEISVPADRALELARILLDEPEVAPAGLGARDSLRLEAGLCLYGHDIDQDTTPSEAGLNWVINKRRREEGGFPGADIILDQIKNGVRRKRVGILPEGRAPAREHTEIQDIDGARIGEITSGGFGPSVGGPIAMGYVASAHAAPDTPVQLIVRGKALPAKVVKMPFVAHNYKIK
ncbi:glycine cleavage system aminomethyltransferase GcvT [Varunaivibrio sulfuroxidans]|uniref:aminomethyltransferase n=1 Tax=Varunaivibrio sulfuroxidans TaxID=1773489 RepID=A0A4R3JAR3_9PROT|nr:glycine cleavage system aminomethyltransferase GcvT [Varunaivibrio sulfuroxidans]TCS62664.1 aminomethyltransferase [Varunaivibrio sulfuroxidans]WES30671.1 glycine cleavage system aminomethyltransferase GcvT [Varunaivibrio sulfuroxidans]